MVNAPLLLDQSEKLTTLPKTGDSMYTHTVNVLFALAREVTLGPFEPKTLQGSEKGTAVSPPHKARLKVA